MILFMLPHKPCAKENTLHLKRLSVFSILPRTADRLNLIFHFVAQKLRSAAL